MSMKVGQPWNGGGKNGESKMMESSNGFQGDDTRVDLAGFASNTSAGVVERASWKTDETSIVGSHSPTDRPPGGSVVESVRKNLSQELTQGGSASVWGDSVDANAISSTTTAFERTSPQVLEGIRNINSLSFASFPSASTPSFSDLSRPLVFARTLGRNPGKTEQEPTEPRFVGGTARASAPSQKRDDTLSLQATPFVARVFSQQQQQHHQQHSLPNRVINITREATTLSDPTQITPTAEVSTGPPPRVAMGNQEHIQTPVLIDNKMEIRSDQETFTSTSEGKDREEDTAEMTAETAMSDAPVADQQRVSSPVPEANALSVGAAGMPVVGTPSTVSTAPSTDEASVGTDLDRLSLKIEDCPQIPPASIMSQTQTQTLTQTAITESRNPLHRRNRSWGEGGLSHHSLQFPADTRTAAPPHAHGDVVGPWAHPSPTPSPLYSPRPPPAAWGQSLVTQGHQRVATFRTDPVIGDNQTNTRGRYGVGVGVARSDPADPWMQQGRTNGETHQYLTPHPRASSGHGYAYAAGFMPSYHQVPTSSGTSTPPRNPRSRGGQTTHRQPVASPSNTGPQSSPNPSRSSSEVLKTLLRKKACLYEPDTSRAVALVSWLVGRELALEYGFFSRQQLQSGVHACVADKIDSGKITRTKVNRCMQIILNSCFHYIIPRPDGTEENGAAFRRLFAKDVQDDTYLLRMLPTPWNDLVVDRETVLRASSGEDAKSGVASASAKKQPPLVTPKSSPRLGSHPSSPQREETDGDADAKRAVLLCFNENVRSAEDVFRCHNEFIRDTANASSLQLSAQEWRSFFGKEAAGAPNLWGNIGIPVAAPESSHRDVLGTMSATEASKFRTTWCAKRYDHDHKLCGFAHVHVNGGWLRRNPTLFNYRDSMCPLISNMADKRAGPNYFVLNECPKGVACEFAHSVEEILYHPNRYKTGVCRSSWPRAGACSLLDVCPNLHPSDSSRPAKKAAESRSPGGRHGRQSQQTSSGSKGSVGPPTGAPMLYASPAPFSDFERHLMMPGLQNLYRRHCSVVRAHLRSRGACRCCYSHFGDDWGISGESPRSSGRSGLPPPRQV